MCMHASTHARAAARTAKPATRALKQTCAHMCMHTSTLAQLRAQPRLLRARSNTLAHAYACNQTRLRSCAHRQNCSTHAHTQLRTPAYAPSTLAQLRAQADQLCACSNRLAHACTCMQTPLHSCVNNQNCCAHAQVNLRTHQHAPKHTCAATPTKELLSACSNTFAHACACMQTPLHCCTNNQNCCAHAQTLLRMDTHEPKHACAAAHKQN
jgi:hypothetical protein